MLQIYGSCYTYLHDHYTKSRHESIEIKKPQQDRRWRIVKEPWAIAACIAR